MYTVEVTFKIIEKNREEEQEELIILIKNSWRMNGQVLGNENIYAQAKNAFKMYLYIPEKDSLDKKYNNKYLDKDFIKLKEVGLANPKVKIIDEKSQDDELCDCKKPSSYILFTTYVALYTSLRCKKCFGTVPLYKIPKIYDDSEYYPLICWQSDYRSCDSLQMNCSVGEKFALKQLGSLDSQLTKDGLKVCKKIEEVTNIKTYYYLYKSKAKSKKQELLRRCPSCGKKWLLKKTLHSLFDFECKRCKLLSNIAYDVK